MKKADLKNGMIVQLRNGDQYFYSHQSISKYKIIFEGFLSCNDTTLFLDIDYFNEDLLYINKNEQDGMFDVVKVYRQLNPWNAEKILIWERGEKSTPSYRLTDDEKTFLKMASKRGYKWIAKDKFGDHCEFYISKPYKKNEYFWESEDDKCPEIAFSDMFQFIKWEDEEPYSFKELLKEE